MSPRGVRTHSPLPRRQVSECKSRRQVLLEPASVGLRRHGVRTQPGPCAPTSWPTVSCAGGALRLDAITRGAVLSIVRYLNSVPVEGFTNSVSVARLTSSHDPLLGGGDGNEPSPPSSGPCRIASISVAALARARATAIFKHKE
eukprot:5072137-Pyramimonas_sp.AAC.1